MFGEVGLKNTFLFPEQECDPVPELLISRQKIGLLAIVWLSFLVMEIRRQDRGYPGHLIR